MTNKFTYGYQEFVNTYGIPRYCEANPALFTAAAFPFLFGVAYGDSGRGLFLLSAGLYLLWNEKANDNAKLGKMRGGIHMGQYMLTMMGLFAVYAGMIYNESVSLWAFTFLGLASALLAKMRERSNQVMLPTSFTPTAMMLPSTPSVSIPCGKFFGNELLFFNSFEMKLLVIFGIIQIFMGTCIKCVNAIYFGERLDFFFEFLPMAVFAASLFIYMIVLIFMKWCIN
jgi:V-type H+-transporting ATPase subunit a